VISVAGNMNRDGGSLIHKIYRERMPMECLRGDKGGNGLLVLIQNHIFEFFYYLRKPYIFFLSV
jgi:hypothetical protein